MGNRIEKINDLIRDNISVIINQELSLKSGVFVSVVKVDTSRDLRYARIFISIYPVSERDYAMKTMKKELYKIQRSLNKKLSMKILPRISFEIDTVQENLGKLEDLFDQIKQEKDGTSN